MRKKFKWLLTFSVSFFFCFFMLVIQSCVATADCEPYRLTQSKVEDLALLAVRGDGQAARSLIYYWQDKRDYANAEFWMVIGAENADAFSTETLCSYYLNRKKNDNEAFARAIYWLYQLAVSDWYAEHQIERLRQNGYTMETAQPPGDDLFPYKEGLSGDEIAQYKGGALKGSGQAALVLATYYNNSTNGAASAEYWYMIGAQNGDNTCRQYYGNILLGKDGKYEQERGDFWRTKNFNYMDKVKTSQPGSMYHQGC